MQKKKGISLIVLVITIIIMIILASTIIISLNNNGVINNAKDAVDKTNEKQVQEIANLAWGEAYVAGKRTVSDLQKAVEDALKANNLKPEDYYIKVTTSGVTIKNINNVWIQKADRTVVRGNTVLNIGSDITYDETNGGTETGLTNVDWKVLGAENGELLIMSATDITSKTFNSGDTLEGAKQAYENGIAELNELCVPYGKGEYALGARSITVEDVDRVTGFDKTTFGIGEVYEYGNVVTIKYNGTNTPAYVGSNGVSGTLKNHSNGFHWYDVNNVYHSVTASDLTNTENNGKEITKLTSTYYEYDVDKKTDLAKGTDAYNMLFGSNDRIYFWLASSYVETNSYYANFGLRVAASGYVRGLPFVGSLDEYVEGRNNRCGVRAVVRLSQDFNP